MKYEVVSGIALVAAALLALIIANSSFHPFYYSFFHADVGFSLGYLNLVKPLIHWINDGLMAIFFFYIGLEVKREFVGGDLSSVRQVILPGVAALAGIFVPASIFWAVNVGDNLAMRGWAISSATDIAFAVGIFCFFGSRLPVSLKVFLLSVAIFDDIGAIIIIALFYTNELSLMSLLFAGTGVTALYFLNRYGVYARGMYLFLACIIWVSVLKSGVHATLAGFIVAWFIPMKDSRRGYREVLTPLEHSLKPWVGFFILPVFAFSNAGVKFLHLPLGEMVNSVSIGILLGLFVGKQLGILGACWVAVKMGWAKLPKGSRWIQLYGVSVLCGIGFTMSLFIGSLAYEGVSTDYESAVKLGVLSGSILSAVLGSIILMASSQEAKGFQWPKRCASKKILKTKIV